MSPSGEPTPPRGLSTGLLPRSLSWAEAVADVAARSLTAIELSALSSTEWPGLVDFLGRTPRLPFAFVSVHAPTKGDLAGDAEMSRAYAALPPVVQVVVQHPDVIAEIGCYAPLGARLAIENMDGRKDTGRTVAELAPLLHACPGLAFVLDVAHAAAIDPTMAEAHAMLDAFGDRLSHLHVSSLDAAGRHVPLTDADRERFAPVFARCGAVPRIHEA